MKLPMKNAIYLLFAFLYSSFNSSAQNNAGDDLFSGLTVHTINIESPLPLDVFWDSLIYYKDQANMNGGDDTYMKVDITIDNVTTYDIGVHLKGNSSYSAPNSGYKKSMKLDFDKYIDGQDYDGMDKLNLNNGIGDPTAMREKLTYDLFNQMGLPAARATFANVYLNDSLWGIYSVVEIVEGTFLKNRFGEKEGNLFKGDSKGHLIWEGDDQNLYMGDYELENNDSLNDWSDLVHLLNIINNTTDGEFEDSLETVLNTDVSIKYWAICNLLVNLDSYLGSGHNYYIYHNISTDKFEWMPWDVNESFGGFTMNGMPSEVEDLYHMAYDFLPTGMDSERPLVERMLENTSYTKQYTDALYELISTYVNNNTLNPKIDSMADVIRSYVYDDPNFPYSTQDFEKNIDTVVFDTPGLKSFIKERVNYLDSVLMSMGYPSAINENIKMENENINIFPNPANDVIYIKMNESTRTSSTFILYNGLGEVVLNKQFPENVLMQSVGLNEIPSGIFFYELRDSNGIIKQGKVVCMGR